MDCERYSSWKELLFLPSGCIFIVLLIGIISSFILLNTKVTITLKKYLKQNIWDFISPSYKMMNIPIKFK